ncbi:type IV secretory system conjugative DNA transfer family protein [Streptomyces sp. C8S0]|uniref:type IV secretory system conjugative DNA transfer family protein n=1 Tax=Streptomyces sp. C8S0 TaxID=2585716 RepID=UPI0021F76A8C|nr:type IV secretory system conjugative DNA transfer family protein [Streptomyces sp. C8S0]
MGATGSGKSTLIANLALDDVRNHRGVIVIDPKGDLVTDLLDRLPDTCADRLVLIDPDDPHTPPCLNVLDGADIDVVVDNITGIFRRIFTAFWGPRTDDLMRAACLTLLKHRERTHQLVTLADVPASSARAPTAYASSPPSKTQSSRASGPGTSPCPSRPEPRSSVR